VTESSERYELSNVVETALAKALVLAAEAKRWDVVMQIADELHRRGNAQASHGILGHAQALVEGVRSVVAR
jgi:hypothetical protein